MTIAPIKEEPSILERVSEAIGSRDPNQPGLNGTMTALAQGNPAAFMNMFHQFTERMGNSGLGSILRGLEPFLDNLTTLLARGMKEITAASKNLTVQGDGVMAANLVSAAGGAPENIRTLVDPSTGQSREAQAVQPQEPRVAAPVPAAPAPPV